MKISLTAGEIACLKTALREITDFLPDTSVARCYSVISTFSSDTFYALRRVACAKETLSTWTVGKSRIDLILIIAATIAMAEPEG